MTTATEPLIGVINAGSSSLKFSFYAGERRLLAGQVDGIGAHPKASAAGADGEAVDPPEPGGKPATAPSELLPAMLPWAREQARRAAACGARPPRRPWRSAPFAAGAGHARAVGRARGAGAARTTARAAQSRPDQDGAAGRSRPAAGGVLRHRVSPHHAGDRAGLRLALLAL